MIEDRSRPAIPEALRKLMAEVGPVWGRSPAAHVKLMTDEFSKVHASAPDESARVELNIEYGPHPRQQFDLYRPKAGGKNRAAVVFVHGGAFVEGHRNRTPEVYSNALRFLARNGVVGVNMGYRMAPECQYPGASEDVGAVVAWTRRHADEWDVDPRRIFVMGHSAGGAHVGGYAYDARMHPPEGSGLAGVIIVSGRVRADTLDENPNARKVEAYYGTDPALLDARSAVSFVGPDSPPTFIAIAQYENPLIDLHCSELAFRLAQAKRRAPPILWLRGHNHTSAVAHLNTAENLLGRSILDFIADPV